MSDYTTAAAAASARGGSVKPMLFRFLPGPSLVDTREVWVTGEVTKDKGTELEDGRWPVDLSNVMVVDDAVDPSSWLRRTEQPLEVQVFDSEKKSTRYSVPAFRRSYSMQVVDGALATVFAFTLLCDEHGGVDKS